MSRMVEGIGLFFQQVYIAIDINPFDLFDMSILYDILTLKNGTTEMRSRKRPSKTIVPYNYLNDKSIVVRPPPSTSNDFRLA